MSQGQLDLENDRQKPEGSVGFAKRKLPQLGFKPSEQGLNHVSHPLLAGFPVEHQRTSFPSLSLETRPGCHHKSCGCTTRKRPLNEVFPLA